MSVGILNGNVFGLYYIQTTITPVAVAGATSPVVQTFTVNGLKASDNIIDVDPPTDVAGIGVIGGYATAANTLGIKFINPTAGSLTPSAGVYTLTVLRPQSGTSALAIGD